MTNARKSYHFPELLQKAAVAITPDGRMTLDDTVLRPAILERLCTTDLYDVRGSLLPQLFDNASPESPHTLRRVTDEVRRQKIHHLTHVQVTLTREQAIQLYERALAAINAHAPQIPNNLRDLPPPPEPGSPRPTFAMVSPYHYAVADNNRQGQFDIYFGWETLRRALIKAGAHVVVVPPTPRLPRPQFSGGRELFLRDKMLLLGDTAFLPDLAAYYQRKQQTRCREEARHFLRTDLRERIKATNHALLSLEQGGLKERVIDNLFFEGGNITYSAAHNTLFLGTDTTEMDARLQGERLAQATSVRVITIPLCDERRHNFGTPGFYHLDTFFRPLPSGEILLNPFGTSEDALNELARSFGRDQILTYDHRDHHHHRYPANMVSVNRTLVMPCAPDNLAHQLRQRGYKILTPESLGLPADCWNFNNGSVCCLTSEHYAPTHIAPTPARQDSPHATEESRHFSLSQAFGLGS